MFLSTAAKSLVLNTTSRVASFSQQRLFHATPEALAKLTVKELAERVNLNGTNVLMRVDLNVPLAKVSEPKMDQNDKDILITDFDSYIHILLLG
jgi:hypothetical protein